MRINLRSFFFLLIVFMMQAVAFSASIDAPRLQPGRYVYSLPNNFDPPLIGRSGLEEIERETHKLHYPFYVVVAQSFNGESTEDLSNAIDGLAATWSRDPLFKRAESSIVILTYQPRKFRLLAASKWRAQYGLEGSGSDEYTNIFSSYAKGSSKDPATGIIECMKALDSYVFENNDPARIAARAEGRRRAEAQRKQQAAASLLDEQINRMEVLLGAEKQFLPSDVSPYRNSLATAKRSRAQNVAAAMLPAAAALKAATDRLHGTVSQAIAAHEAEVQKKRDEDNARLRARITAYLCGLLVFGLLAVLFASQRREFLQLREKFKKSTDSWDGDLKNAAENYVRFFEERMAVKELETTTGHTKEKYDEITSEIGIVYPKIEAMQQRIERGRQVAVKASLVNLKPLKDALKLLDADFEFDVETLNRKALFEPPSRLLQVKPGELRKQIAQLYSENIDDWDELMKALQLRATIAQDAFPQARLDAMLKAADEKKIPHGYFASHPLFGEGEADKRLYDELNSFRLSDPLLYLERVNALLETQTALENLLSRLGAAIDLAASRRTKTLPVYGETVVAPEDDPGLTLAQANRADEQVAGMLAAQKEVEAVEKAAQTTADLYTKAVEQAGSIQAAIANVGSDISALQSHWKSVEQLQAKASDRLQLTQAVHSNTATAATSLSNGSDYVKRAVHFAEKTTRLLSENRHLDARKTAQEGERHLALAEEEFNQCIRACEQLDAIKAQYEKQAALVDAARMQAQASIDRYGGGLKVRAYQTPRFVGPVDYAILTNQVNDYRQEIETAARNVRLAYQEEQARIEREAERARQAAAAASYSSSHSSSSSGSDWSSSSSSFSSSSGSDWGSSSSSSSSSSSGTDW